MLARIKEARPGSLDHLHDAAIVWRYMAPVGHTLEDCQRPDYFTNVVREAGQQRVVGRHAWNIIQIIADDGSWAAELLVIAISDKLVRTRLLHHWDWSEKAEQPAPSGYAVEHVGNNGWRAIAPNGAVLIEKRQTREEALQAAVEHQAKAARPAQPQQGGKPNR